MVSATIGYELANLFFYGICAIPSIFCLVTSGLPGLGCWLNTIILIGVRLAGNALAYQASTAGGMSIAAIAINGIGVNPLTLAAGGLLGNANFSIRPKLHPLARGWGTLISTILVIVGNSVGLAGMKNPPLLAPGMWILFAGWLLICGMCVASWCSTEHLNRRPEEMQMLMAASLALAFVGVRIIYLMVVGFREGGDVFIDGGGVTLEIALGCIPEFISVTAFLAAGLATWKLGSKRRAEAKRAKEGIEGQELVNKHDNESIVSF